MRLMKVMLAAGLALTIASTSFVSTADARHRNRHHHPGNDFAAGILGFSAGALLGALAQPRYGYGRGYGRGYGYYDDDYDAGYYYEEPRYYYAPPPRLYYYAPAPRIYYRQVPDYYGPCSIPGGSRSRPAWAMC